LSIKKHAKILLAEKDTDNLKIICDAFKHSGYQNIATATTGSDALAKIQSFQPDLILLSTKQTDTDGFAMCQQLKADERTQHILHRKDTTLKSAQKDTALVPLIL